MSSIVHLLENTAIYMQFNLNINSANFYNPL